MQSGSVTAREYGVSNLTVELIAGDNGELRRKHLSGWLVPL